jgi:4,4'-diaponeurosporenoate glycosyltransferase
MNEPLPWVLLCFWLFGFWFLWRVPLPGGHSRRGPVSRSVSVVIPARNEEANLGRLLESLKRQSPGPMEVIVVDDQSEDGTAAVARRHGCRVLQAADLPPGWAGKPWACWRGAHEARGDLLLFLDADTFLEEGGLERVRASVPEAGGLVTVQPYHRMERAYERLSAVFNIIVHAGSRAFTPLGERVRPMGAFGPCILCPREDYFEVGGHERVRGEILESIGLGRAFLEAGRRVLCFGGRGVLFFRMYGEGLRAMVEGFSKGFGSGAGAVSRVVLLMIVCWVFGSVSLTRHLVQSALLGEGVPLAVWAGLYLLYGLQLHWMLYRIGNFGLWPALLFPVPVIFFVLVFLLSLFKTIFLGKARWKGRTVDTGGEKGAVP